MSKSATVRKYWQYLFVALIAAVPYLQTINYDYALDDTIFITKNPRVQNGLMDIPSLFENKQTGELQYKTGYRPILLLSYATDVQLFGMNPKAMHRINVLLYVLLCLVVFRTLIALFPENTMLMLFVSALFAIHPLHVEAVANIKGRDEILAMLFGMIFLHMQIRHIKNRQFSYLIFAPLFYVLAVLSKESAIVFAGLSLALWIISGHLSAKERVFQAVSSVAALLLILAVRVFVYSDAVFENRQQNLEQMGTYHWDGFIGNPLFDVSDTSILLANAFNIIYQSVKLFAVPYPLVHDYSYNHFPLVNWGSYETYLGLAIVLGGLAMVFIEMRNKRSELAFGILWFLISISVYLSLVQRATDIFAERFLFTPSLGLALFSVVTASRIPVFSSLKTFRMVVGIWLLILSVLTVLRCPAWKNTETLMRTDIENLSDCVRANYNYALFLHQKYDNNPRFRTEKSQQEILKHYNRALSQSDRLANLYIALGNAYMRFGMPDKGLEVFREAVEKYPELVKPGIQIGTYYFIENKYDSAAFYFRKALDAGKANSEVYLKLGLSLYHNGDDTEALTVMDQGLPFAGKNVEYYQKYITMCIKLNKLLLAEEITDKAYQLFPTDPKIIDYYQQFQRRRENVKLIRR